MKISGREIYTKFLEFFKSQEHLIIENSSILTDNDPTLLFINSGMAPIKKYFTGEKKPPAPRLCNAQTCIRTIDIDSVGDSTHLTSFLMLGNWGINNYFKREAIHFAYEFITKILKIDKARLYVTVFAGDKDLGLDFDHDSQKFWIEAGIPKERIVACGKDNFWGPTSDTGPCGPCTEIFYDTGNGEEYVPGGHFDTEHRYMEIWNAGVFMQLNKNVDGSFSNLNFVSVDAGAGLERMETAINGLGSVYDTDLLLPIMEKICEKLPKNHNVSVKDLRILTDHLRTSSIILSEKINPSNEGRGYVLRRLIRKCVMITAKNHLKNFDFDSVLKFILREYSVYFGNFKDSESFVLRTFLNEKNQFERVIESGIKKLESMAKKAKNIDASTAFELVTTHGMPIDIIKDFASENNLTVDEIGFNKKFSEHKEISKKAEISVNLYSVDKISGLENLGKTKFLGYECNRISAKILKIIVENTEKKDAFCGEKVALVLDETCLYAESGGQCSDTGKICAKDGSFQVNIDVVRKNKNGVFVHFGKIMHGNIKIFDEVEVTFDSSRRSNLARNHSCAHLLQSALRKIFGKSVCQAGSKIEENYFRFDFNLEKSISTDEIFQIEHMVNDFIRQNVPLKIENLPLDKAIANGAIALFESKYGDIVRVVNFENVSMELCGGTHTSMTGNIGFFAISSVDGIGKGIKRITGLTGFDAVEFLHAKMRSFNEIVSILRTRPEIAVETLKRKLKDANRQNQTTEKIDVSEIETYNLSTQKKIGLITKKVNSKGLAGELKDVSNRFGATIVCLAGSDSPKQILVVVPKNYDDNAKDILNTILEKLGGKGGGNENLACGSVNADSINAIKDVLGK